MADQVNFHPRWKVEVESFHFLKLPLEIRTMIYVLLLERNELMSPDPTRLNERMLQYEPEEIHSYEADSGLRLMRTCKQIHDEATSVLYGRNRFSFADRRDARDDKHWCELESLPIWLRYIGRQNVRKIRSLRIEMNGHRGAFSHREPDVPDLGTKGCPIGDALIQAFDYLSSGHNLQVLELCFPSPLEFAKAISDRLAKGVGVGTLQDWLQTGGDQKIQQLYCEMAYCFFFRRVDTAILQSLRKLRVRKFICPDLHNVFRSEASVARAVKAEIESHEHKET